MTRSSQLPRKSISSPSTQAGQPLIEVDAEAVEMHSKNITTFLFPETSHDAKYIGVGSAVVMGLET